MDADYEVTWTSPAQDTRTRANLLLAEVNVTKRDGGVVPAGVLPQVFAPASSSATLQGTSLPVGVQLGLGASDGVYVFEAGWADGGMRAPLRVQVDRTGPQYQLVVMSDAGLPAGNAEFYPAEPSGRVAFRKDALVKIRAITDAGDVSSVALTAHFGTQADFTVTTSSNCTSGGGRCDEFELDLSRVAMNDFRGDIEVEVVATDDLTNPATATPVLVPVTRWNWARQIGNAAALLKSTPAIGTGGRIFVPRANLDGGVVAIDPDGFIVWAASDAVVEGPIAVGRGSNGNEFVFYQPRLSASKSIQSATGSGGQACPAGSSGNNAGGVVLLAEGTNQVAGVSLQSGVANNRIMQNSPGVATPLIT